MTINDYQRKAGRTVPVEISANADSALVNGALGLCGESGEVADIIKKHRFQGHDLNRTKVIEELGDVCWYIAMMATALGVSLEDVLEKNILKLIRRYPDGFDAERSINRPEYRTERTESGLTEDE